MKKTKWKKLASILLCSVLVLSICTIIAIADDEAVSAEAVIETMPASVAEDEPVSAEQHTQEETPATDAVEDGEEEPETSIDPFMAQIEEQKAAAEPEPDITEEVPEQQVEQDEQGTTEENQNIDEEQHPSWSIQIPDNPPVKYGAEVVTVSVATAVNVENLGDSTIYLTITSDCIFSGNADKMPVILYVGDDPVTPGEAAVYGTITSAGAEYAPVTLVFSEGGWSALSSGLYSMTITYDSYIG